MLLPHFSMALVSVVFVLMADECSDFVAHQGDSGNFT